MDTTDEEWNPGPGPSGAPRRHFRIVKLLGIGGFGSVYEALLERPDGFRKTVALKILHDEDVPPYVLRRFRDEAKLLGLLRDRAVVSVDVPTKLMDRWSIIMECIDGATASQVLKFIGPIPPRVALSIVGEIARALHKVYHLVGEDGQPIQLIHRDIKAANVSITREGDVKILDFGIARANFSARESSTLQNAGPDGTVGYIAPERFESIEGPEGDIYSLGVTLYVMLTRVRPTHIDRRVDHPEAAMRSALETAVQMCELQAEKRPTAHEVYRRCRALVERMPGPSLHEWAERVVPDAQEAAQRALSMSEEGDKLGLVGTILTEEPSKKPIMKAAPVTSTPSARPPREVHPASTPSPRLRVRTAKVRVPTGDVPPPRTGTPVRTPVPSRGMGQVPTRPASVYRRATPSGVSTGDRRSLPPLPPRQFTPRPAPGRQRTPPSLPRRPVERPSVDHTNPDVDLDMGDTRVDLESPPSDPRWTAPQLAPAELRPLRRSRPGRFLAAGVAGVFTTMVLFAGLAVGTLWIAENRPAWLEAAGVELPPEALQALDLAPWMFSGAEGLFPQPVDEGVVAGSPDALDAVPPPPPRGAGVRARMPTPSPTPVPARAGPDEAATTPVGSEESASEPPPLLLPPPADGTAEDEGLGERPGVKMLFQPPGVTVEVDGRQVTRDSPARTTLSIEAGERHFRFELPDGSVLEQKITVGGEDGATLVELREGELATCRPPPNVTRCID